MPISYDSARGLLSIPAAELSMDFEEISPRLNSFSKRLKPVDRVFWIWQLEHRDELSNILLAQEGLPDTLVWKGLPAISRIDYLPQLIEQLSSLKKLFQEDQESIGHSNSKALFYNKNDVICRINGESSKFTNLVKADGSTVIEHKRGSFLVFTAAISGYLMLSESSIHLSSPEEQSTDGLELNCLLLPVTEGSRLNLKSYLNQLIKNLKKSHPKAPYKINDSSELDILLGSQEVQRIPITLGRPSKQGRNAELELLVQRDMPTGDTIDFHQVKQYITVEKGDLLACKHQMIKGVTGIDALGNITEVDSVEDLSITISGPIEEEYKEDQILYRAAESGLFQVRDNHLELKETLCIDNNLDYHTGNIEFDKAVIVKGDVKAGFSLRSKSDVVIHGCVEDGVQIEAGGDTLVMGGIVGRNTRITAEKDVQAIYMQDAILTAKGDIYIEKNVLRGRIYCDGTLTVEGKGIKSANRGAVLGGDYSAFNGMVLHSVGSELAPTSISAGYNSLISKQVESIRKELALLERQQISIMNEIPGEICSGSVSAKRKLALLTEAQKEKLQKNLLEMKRLSEVRERISLKISSLLLREYADEKKTLPVLRIHNNLFGPLYIQIGRTKRVFQETNSKRKIIRLNKEKIQMDDL